MPSSIDAADAEARTARRPATAAPTKRPDAADAGNDRRSRAGPRPRSRGGEEQVGRPEDAPQDMVRAVGRGDGAQNRRAATIRSPSRISRSTGSRSTTAGRWRLLPPDRRQEERRDDERDGVDSDGDRRRQDLDQKAADSEARELGDRSARGEGAVRDDEPALRDDVGRYATLGDVEEGREDRSQEGDEQELGQAEHAGEGGHGDRAEEDGPAEVRATIMIGRRRSRSTHAPANSPTISASRPAPRS